MPQLAKPYFIIVTKYVRFALNSCHIDIILPKVLQGKMEGTWLVFDLKRNGQLAGWSFLVDPIRKLAMKSVVSKRHRARLGPTAARRLHT